MNARERGIPAAVMALLGALLAGYALTMPWFDFNDEGIAKFIADLGSKMGTGTGVTASNLPLDHIQAGVRTGIALVRDQYEPHLTGLKVLTGPWLGAYGLAIGLAVWSAFGLFVGRRLPAAALLVAAGVVGGRSGWAMWKPPGTGDLQTLGFDVHLFVADTGVQMGLLAALILVAAAVASSMSAGSGRAVVPAVGGFSGINPGGAHVPMPGSASMAAMNAPAAAAPTTIQPIPRAPAAAPTTIQPIPRAPAAAPAPTSIQPIPRAPVAASAHPATPKEAPVPDHIPTPYQPSDSAYGDEGPSTLDRQSRLVRPHDPYAPKATHQPVAPSVAEARAAAKAAARAQARPAERPNAFASPQGPFGTAPASFGMAAGGSQYQPDPDGVGDAGSLGVYGVQPTRPAAQPPAHGAQPRKGSVAPPGLG